MKRKKQSTHEQTRYVQYVLTTRSAAVLPKNVSAPVNSTVPSTSPLTTVEPILQESP